MYIDKKALRRALTPSRGFLVLTVNISYHTIAYIFLRLSFCFLSKAYPLFDIKVFLIFFALCYLFGSSFTVLAVISPIIKY